MARAREIGAALEEIMMTEEFINRETSIAILEAQSPTLFMKTARNALIYNSNVGLAPTTEVEAFLSTVAAGPLQLAGYLEAKKHGLYDNDQQGSTDWKEYRARVGEVGKAVTKYNLEHPEEFA